MEINRDRQFEAIRSAHQKVDDMERLVKCPKGFMTDFDLGNNGMYKSQEISCEASNNVAYLETVTIEKTDDFTGEKCGVDMIQLHIDDCCDNELDFFMTKDKCMELIRYLATAATLLRD